jgi:hypothetical protein
LFIENFERMSAQDSAVDFRDASVPATAPPNSACSLAHALMATETSLSASEAA